MGRACHSGWERASGSISWQRGQVIWLLKSHLSWGWARVYTVLACRAVHQDILQCPKHDRPFFKLSSLQANNTSIL
jgi:hypothetical protein